MTMTLQALGAQAAALAEEYARLNLPCRDQHQGSPTCLQREAERPLSNAEHLLGYVHRPEYAFRPDWLCATCAARWHLLVAGELLRFLHDPRVKAGKAGGGRAVRGLRKEGVA